MANWQTAFSKVQVSFMQHENEQLRNQMNNLVHCNMKMKNKIVLSKRVLSKSRTEAENAKKNTTKQEIRHQETKMALCLKENQEEHQRSEKLNRKLKEMESKYSETRYVLREKTFRSEAMTEKNQELRELVQELKTKVQTAVNQKESASQRCAIFKERIRCLETNSNSEMITQKYESIIKDMERKLSKERQRWHIYSRKYKNILESDSISISDHEEFLKMQERKHLQTFQIELKNRESSSEVCQQRIGSNIREFDDMKASLVVQLENQRNFHQLELLKRSEHENEFQILVNQTKIKYAQEVELHNETKKQLSELALENEILKRNQLNCERAAQFIQSENDDKLKKLQMYLESKNLELDNLKLDHEKLLSNLNMAQSELHHAKSAIALVKKLDSRIDRENESLCIKSKRISNLLDKLEDISSKVVDLDKTSLLEISHEEVKEIN